MIFREYGSIDELWTAAGSAVMNGGVKVDSRAGKTMEALGLHARIVNGSTMFLCNPERKLSKSYAAAELLWYLGGSSCADLVKAYAPQYEQFLDDGVHAYGAYGERWHSEDQVRNVWKILRSAPNSRQAVMHCWDMRDLQVAKDGTSKDVPCTLTLQFIRREEELHLIVNMRSNDWWLGMPYDIWCFSRLQAIMAAMLDVDVGVYQHQVGSLHVYEEHWERAKNAMALRPDIDYKLQPEDYRFPIDCPDTLEKLTARALGLEEKIRADPPHANSQAITNLLGGKTLHAELVHRCAAKWVDLELKSNRT